MNHSCKSLHHEVIYVRHNVIKETSCSSTVLTQQSFLVKNLMCYEFYKQDSMLSLNTDSNNPKTVQECDIYFES
jgi:hypothetical protein